MGQASRRSGDPGDAHPREPRLDSWKAIACHLDRDVSTVRRWEKREGLPVHRHLHQRLGSVYAFPSEIDAWWRSRRTGADLAERGQPPCEIQGREGVALDAQNTVSSVPVDVATALGPGRRAPLVAVLAALVLALVTLVVAALRAPVIPAGPTASIAVLPFQHAAASVDAQVLVDGLTEGVINTLSTAPDLKVISRTSVFRYQGRDIAPRQIGRELGVRAVLLGRVVPRNGRLSVVVELVDTGDDRQIWGATYERSVADLAVLTGEIAGQVGRTLTGRDQAGPASRYSRSAGVYELYLRGRYHWNKRTPEALGVAVNEFGQAVERDPAFALAYAGLADAYVLMVSFYHLIPFDEARAKAREAAVKALEIDESLAESHTSMAGVLELGWDWEGAEREYRKAIQLAPNYVTAHHWYANNLSIRDRHAEAIALGTRAVELDPLSPIVHVALGHAYYLAGRLDDAIGQLRTALEIEPSFANAHQFLGQAYARKGWHEEAVAEFRRSADAGRWVWTSALVDTYVRMGRHDDATRIVRSFADSRPQVSLVTTAALYAAAGEHDRPLTLLQRACDQRDPDVSFIKSLPALESLRADPAFQALLRRVGLS